MLAGLYSSLMNNENSDLNVAEYGLECLVRFLQQNSPENISRTLTVRAENIANSLADICNWMGLSQVHNSAAE